MSRASGASRRSAAVGLGAACLVCLVSAPSAGAQAPPPNDASAPPPNAAPPLPPAPGAALPELPAPASPSPPQAAAAPAAPSPATQTPAEAAVRSPEARADGAFTTGAVEIGFALGVVGRRFTYSDPVSANIRDYNVFGGVAPELQIAVYPLVNTGVVVLRDLGFALSASTALGLSSASSDGTTVASSLDRMDLGLRERVFPAARGGVMLGLTGGFSLQRFAYETQTLADEVPSVSYVSATIALDARLPIGARTAVTLGLGYIAPLAAGDVYDRFRGATVGGVDAKIGASLAFAEGLEVRAVGQYTRFFYSFTPMEGDSYVAGGALDEFIRLSLGVAYAY